MANDKSITESEAEKMIKKNEREIDRKEKDKEKKEKRENFWGHTDQDKKEGFIGLNTDKNRDPQTRVLNTAIAALNIIAFVFIFLWIPSYLWVTLTEFKRPPGYSGNQVSGTDPFKPPYTKKAPSGVKSASVFEMGDMSYFDCRKHGWPYTWAQEVDDIGDGDFVYPHTIWANHVRDMFVQARNMFDGFLDIYKSIIGPLPTVLNPKVPNTPQSWFDTFRTFFGVFWVTIVTLAFLAIGTGYLAQRYIGIPLGIPMISLIYATLMIFTDAFRMKECQDKAYGFLWSKIWWTPEDQAGWFAAPWAKVWRLAYRAALTGMIYSLNMFIAMYILPLYGLYWLFGRQMPQTNKTVWYVVRKLISKYFIIITLFVLLGLAGFGNAEMYPAWFKVKPRFWQGGPKWRGDWKNVGGQKADYWWGLIKKIGVGYPYVLAILMLIALVGNIFSSFIPWSGKLPDKVTDRIELNEFIIPKEQQWAYTGPNHTKYGMDAWGERWMEQIKEGLNIKPPCGDKPKSSRTSAPGPSVQGMVFDSVMNAANNQPGVKMARGLNAAANNPALNKKVALGALALGATGAAGPVGAAVGSAATNRALGAALQKGGKRRKRRK